jgi:hypothetical protein
MRRVRRERERKRKRKRERERETERQRDRERRERERGFLGQSAPPDQATIYWVTPRAPNTQLSCILSRLIGALILRAFGLWMRPT